MSFKHHANLSKKCFFWTFLFVFQLAYSELQAEVRSNLILKQEGKHWNFTTLQREKIDGKILDKF